MDVIPEIMERMNGVPSPFGIRWGVTSGGATGDWRREEIQGRICLPLAASLSFPGRDQSLVSGFF